ncbi:MAG: hypothetical protein O2983_10275 [Planctomycetota bacterium]|nr:hypothetical protein [Planctomycetota bacterium]
MSRCRTMWLFNTAGSFTSARSVGVSTNANVTSIPAKITANRNFIDRKTLLKPAIVAPFEHQVAFL